MVESTYSDVYPTQQNDANSFLEEVLDDLVQRFIVNIPPEDFQSFERLFFHIEEAHWFYDDFWREEAKSRGFLLSYLPFPEFAELIFHHCPFLAPYKHAVQHHTKSFMSYKTRVPVCGAIIFNQNLSKLILVKGFTSKVWNFPRGKISKGESDVACAIREVKEEVGFDISSYVNENQFVKHGNVKLFIVAGVPDSTLFSTQTRKEISEIKWHHFETLVKNQSTKQFAIIGAFMKQLCAWVKQSSKSFERPAPANNNSAVQYTPSPSRPVPQKNSTTNNRKTTTPEKPNNNSTSTNPSKGQKAYKKSPPRSSNFTTPEKQKSVKQFTPSPPSSDQFKASSFAFSFNADEILA